MNALRIALSLGSVALLGCAGKTPVRNEQALAKRIGLSATVEGTLSSDAGGIGVKTIWGVVPVEPKFTPVIPPGDYVYANGVVARGKLTPTGFVPSQPDFRGIRPQHDLVLREAKVQRHTPPSTEPTMWDKK